MSDLVEIEVGDFDVFEPDNRLSRRSIRKQRRRFAEAFDAWARWERPGLDPDVPCGFLRRCDEVLAHDGLTNHQWDLLGEFPRRIELVAAAKRVNPRSSFVWSVRCWLMDKGFLTHRQERALHNIEPPRPRPGVSLHSIGFPEDHRDYELDHWGFAFGDEGWDDL